MLKCILVSAGILLSSFGAWAQSNGLIGKSAPGFTLEDQFDKKTTVKFPTKQPVILLFSDREKESAKQADKWGSELVSEYGKDIQVVVIAVTGKGAKMVKNKVQNGFKKSDPILFDWDNDVAKQYQYDDKACMVIYITKSGTVEAVETGSYTEAKYNKFTEKLDGELE